MNVTFSSKNKKTIQYIINYFYTNSLTSDNFYAHLKHLQDKYARGVVLVVHEPLSIQHTNKKCSKKINIRFEEKN